MFNETDEFVIIADGRFYAVKQGLPNHETYEQAIMWSEDEDMATVFTYKETGLYLDKFKELLGKDHKIDCKKVEKDV